jgi:hypothetical protein
VERGLKTLETLFLLGSIRQPFDRMQGLLMPHHAREKAMQGDQSSIPMYTNFENLHRSIVIEIMAHFTIYPWSLIYHSGFKTMTT